MVVAIGIGMAMTPATDSIMSALPREQFGVGSAVNDTVREIGGALGVAVLGSVFAAGYAGRMSDAIVGLPAEVADAATGSLAGALAVAAQLGGEAGLVLAVVARDAFVAAQSMTSLIGVAFAIGGALIALAWMPDRIDRTGEATDAAGAEADARDGAVASAPA
jgi:hypothetical protein